MKKIEIEGLTITDLQNLIQEAVEKAIEKYKEEDKKPSDWEELTLEEAAAELRCSKQTIRRRMKIFKIKGCRIGRETTVQRKDLKRLKVSEKRDD